MARDQPVNPFIEHLAVQRQVAPGVLDHRSLGSQRVTPRPGQTLVARLLARMTGEATAIQAGTFWPRSAQPIMAADSPAAQAGEIPGQTVHLQRVHASEGASGAAVVALTAAGGSTCPPRGASVAAPVPLQMQASAAEPAAADSNNRQHEAAHTASASSLAAAAAWLVMRSRAPGVVAARDFAHSVGARASITATSSSMTTRLLARGASISVPGSSAGALRTSPQHEIARTQEVQSLGSAPLPASPSGAYPDTEAFSAVPSESAIEARSSEPSQRTMFQPKAADAVSVDRAGASPVSAQAPASDQLQARPGQAGSPALQLRRAFDANAAGAERGRADVSAESSIALSPRPAGVLAPIARAAAMTDVAEAALRSAASPANVNVDAQPSPLELPARRPLAQPDATSVQQPAATTQPHTDRLPSQHGPIRRKADTVSMTQPAAAPAASAGPAPEPESQPGFGESGSAAPQLRRAFEVDGAVSSGAASLAMAVAESRHPALSGNAAAVRRAAALVGSMPHAIQRAAENPQLAHAAAGPKHSMEGQRLAAPLGPQELTSLSPADAASPHIASSASFALPAPTSIERTPLPITHVLQRKSAGAFSLQMNSQPGARFAAGRRGEVDSSSAASTFTVPDVADTGMTLASEPSIATGHGADRALSAVPVSPATFGQVARTPLSVHEIDRTAAGQPAAMVWRKQITRMQHAAPAVSATATPSTLLARQQDSLPSAAEAPPISTPTATPPGIDLEHLIEQVGRRLARRLEVERERKGVRSWR